MFAVLDQMKDVGELHSWPLWKAHTLTGDRKEPSRQTQLATDVCVDADELLDVSFEDYH
jgi:hypothetical protein